MVTLASLARYAATGSLWVVTLALVALGDRAPRRVYPGMLTVAAAAAAAVTAGVLADELTGRREDPVLTSCLSALEIDRRLAAEGGARGKRHLRAVGSEGELHRPAPGYLVAPPVNLIREIG